MGAQQKDLALIFRQVGQRRLQPFAVATQAPLLLRAGLRVGLGMLALVVFVVPGLMPARLAPMVDQAVARDLVQPGLCLLYTSRCV